MYSNFYGFTKSSASVVLVKFFLLVSFQGVKIRYTLCCHTCSSIKTVCSVSLRDGFPLIVINKMAYQTLASVWFSWLCVRSQDGIHIVEEIKSITHDDLLHSSDSKRQHPLECFSFFLIFWKHKNNLKVVRWDVDVFGYRQNKSRQDLSAFVSK